MATKTDLSRPPYFDDHDPDKNYHRIMHRPSAAVQARELTQAQSIAQDQIEKFGRHIFTEGSVVENCQLTMEPGLFFLKIRDSYANGTAFTLADFDDKYIVSQTTSLTSLVTGVSEGSLSTPPDLNTLFIHPPLNAGLDGVTKFYSPDEVLTVYTKEFVPIGDITTANAGVSGYGSYTGKSYRMGVSNGTIFQKGFFVGVEAQTIIVSKYDNFPDAISVGFETIETLVTPEQDESLLDNAAGSPNYAAPGAHRLKLTPTLTIQSTDGAAVPNTFFSLVDFIEGQPARASTDPNYSLLGKELARRTDEESGDYVIEPFYMRTRQKLFANGDIDTENLKLEVDKGLAYVAGYRVETLSKVVSNIRRGTDVRFVENQVVTVSLGNFTFANEFAGHWDTESAPVVSLRSATAEAVTTAVSNGTSVDSLSAPGSEIGTARLTAIEFDSGDAAEPDAVYRVYLFNVVMNSGQNFSSVRSLYTDDGGSKGFADLVLSSGSAVLNDVDFQSLIYPLNTQALKTLKDEANTVDTQFDYHTHQSITLANTGVGTINVPSHIGGVNEWPFGLGALDSVSERQFIIVADASANTANGAGGVDITSSTNTATWHAGNTSDFSAQLAVGDLFVVGNSSSSEVRRVTFANVTHLQVANNFTNSWSNAAHWITYRAGQIVPFNSRSNSVITITSGTAATINIGRTTISPFQVTVFHDVRRTEAVPARKVYHPSLFVKIACNAHPNSSNGPWDLGVSDAIRIKNVWFSREQSNSTLFWPQEENGTLTDGSQFQNITPFFAIDSGQRDLTYDTGKAVLIAPGVLQGNDHLMIEFSAFTPDTSQGAGFYSVDSYPINDTDPQANTIVTQAIPTYISKRDGSIFNLRNCIDFRIVASNTANLSTTANGATVNPSATQTYDLPDGTFFPVVDSSFEADIQYYLGRRDIVSLSTKGRIVVTEGTPDENPAPPVDVQAGLTLARVYVPPYPSLSTDEVKDSRVYGAAVTFDYIQNRRYTMRDIGALDSRLKTVEYYTSLNTLEQSTKNLLIPSTTGGDRFKNGIFVDPFNETGQFGDVTNFGYSIAIDPINSEARPIFDTSFFDLRPTVVADGGNHSGTETISISTNGRLITTECEEVPAPYLIQAYATQLRNPSQDVTYRWAGQVTLTPDGDYRPDVTVNPDVVVNIGSISGPIQTPGWSTTWGDWVESGRSTSVTQSGTPPTQGSEMMSVWVNCAYDYGTGHFYYIDDSTGQRVDIPFGFATGVGPGLDAPLGGGGVTNQFRYPVNLEVLRSYTGSWATTETTTVNYTRVGTQKYVGDPTVNTYDLGGYVTSVKLQPYIRPQNISFRAHGLKPNARHWCFFDDDPITAQIIQTNAQGVGTNFGVNSALMTDATGSIYGIFVVPANEFRTGERKFRILDIEDLVTEMTILQSSCSTIFYGTNLAYAKNNIKLQTTSQQVYQTTVYDFTSSTTSYTTPGSGGYTDTVINCDCYASPCAQSFQVPQERIGNVEVPVVFLSKIRLFFERKDPTLGLQFMIREMENGYPSPRIVAFSDVHLESDDIETSEDATAATDVVFAAPVMLETNKEYCIVVKADGFNPNYALWTGALGGSPDVGSGLPVFHNSFVGNLFTSSNDAGWQSYQQEDFKISIFRYTFALHGTAVLVNDDSEYIRYDSLVGQFQAGEKIYFSNDVFQANSVSCVNASATIGLTTTTGLAANSKIYVFSNTHATAFVANVQSVINSTAITVNSAPAFTDADCELGRLRNNGLLNGIFKVVTNIPLTYAVGNSTSNSSFYVLANTKMIGEYSNATCNVNAVVDIPYNTLMPKLALTIPAGTSITFNMIGTANLAQSYVEDTIRLPVNYTKDQTFYDRERVVKSKTNEIISVAGAKSLRVYANLISSSEKMSPVIDTIKMGMQGMHNNVNAEDANLTIFTSEKGNFGNSFNRYLSKAVTLVDGQDSEDLRVYVAAYRPEGTTVYVYAKLSNAFDGDAFVDKVWTPLSTNSALVSSKSDPNDFVEYTYTLPEANTDPGDNSAYLNTDNSGIVRYQNANGQVFDTFKTFQLKVVLTSEVGSHRVPRLQDIRAIALMAP